MSTDWRSLCDTLGWTVDGRTIRVRLSEGRGQSIVVEEHAVHYVLRSVVARAAEVREVQDPVLKCWQRNRSVALVGFRVDESGRIVGECRVPRTGINVEEWQFAVLHMAEECDRFEFQLTGQDRE